MKAWIVCCVIYLILVATWLSVNAAYLVWRNGYLEGQRDALRGTYRIDQAERDAIDPEGKRHAVQGKQ